MQNGKFIMVNVCGNVVVVVLGNNTYNSGRRKKFSFCPPLEAAAK